MRCYRLVRKIERLEAGSYQRRGRYPHVSDGSRKYLINKAQKQLRELKVLEEGVNEDANAFQIEMLLDAVVRACPTEPSWINKGINSCLHSGLNQEAKNLVYAILLDIVENLKYRGLKTPNSKDFL
jgi:hypothetical protein